ncbi:MAG: AlpA family phage regulatory protein [Chromatiaceae bacterium]
MSRTFVLSQPGFLRLRHIIGDPKSDPPLEPIVPVGKSTWWEGVRTGRFPKPVKLGPRTTAWRIEDIRKLIEELGQHG